MTTECVICQRPVDGDKCEMGHAQSPTRAPGVCFVCLRRPIDNLFYKGTRQLCASCAPYPLQGEMMLDDGQDAEDALEKGGERAGQYLDSIGKTDLGQLDANEWRTFLGHVLAGYSDHMRAFDRLKEVAARGEPCPSNREMGEWLGFSPGWAQTMLEILNRNDLIRVFARKSIRKIMIVSTGAETAPNSKRVNDDLPEIRYKVVTNYGGAPTVRYDPADPSTIPPGAQLVHRDPCPFCAVRGDIGCEHSRRRAA